MLGLGLEQDGTEWTIHLQMWTGGAVPLQYRTDLKNASMDNVTDIEPDIHWL